MRSPASCARAGEEDTARRKMVGKGGGISVGRVSGADCVRRGENEENNTSGSIKGHCKE
jgi:hypothetical protein